MKKYGIRSVAAIIGLFLFYVVGVLCHGTYYDYQPASVIELEPSQNAAIAEIEDSITLFRNMECRLWRPGS